MNPDPFKLRELLLMAEGRGKLEWGRTSCLMALVANLMRDPKKSKGVKPEDFNPYCRKQKPKIKAPASILRDVFVRPSASDGAIPRTEAKRRTEPE